MQILSLRYRQPKLVQYSLFAFLAVLIVMLGHLEAPLKEFLIRFFEKNLYLLNSNDEVLGEISMNSTSFVNMIYRILYCSVCLLAIHLFYLKVPVTKMALILYSTLFCLVILLYGAAHLLHSEPLRIIGFRIDSLLVSPMPVMLIIAALYLKIPFRT